MYVQGLVYLCWEVLAHIYVDIREQLVGAGFHSSPSEFQYLRTGNLAWTQPHLPFKPSYQLIRKRTLLWSVAFSVTPPMYSEYLRSKHTWWLCFNFNTWKWSWEIQKFKTILYYRTIMRPAWATWEPNSIKTEIKKTEEHRIKILRLKMMQSQS